MLQLLVQCQHTDIVWFLRKILALHSSWGRKLVKFWGPERAGGSLLGIKRRRAWVLEVGQPLLAPWWVCVTRQLQCH